MPLEATAAPPLTFAKMKANGNTAGECSSKLLTGRKYSVARASSVMTGGRGGSFEQKCHERFPY